jgi:tripartite-type tricarboxylate transporter receptor subunit TctC
MKMLKLIVGPVIALALVGSALAQDYPVKAVRVVLPYTPGSATDIFGRLVCQKLSELWAQQVLVDNRTGAGGSIGSAAVAKSPADGYTLLWNSNALVINAALQKSLPYDPEKDFAPITGVVRQPFALVVGAAAGPRTIADLVAAGKANPGRLSFASAGIGTATHFIAEKFKAAAGVEAIHVPYRGGPEANSDVIAGRVSYWFAPIVMAVASARDGRVIPLALTSAQRSQLLPDVPTMAEAGVQGADYSLWNGLWAPAGTPVPIVEKIAKDVAHALSAPELRERLTKLGAEPMATSPAEFARFVRSELDEALRIARLAAIKPE